MDGSFCAPVRFDGFVAVEVVDAKWMAQTLPSEHVEVPVAPASADAEPSASALVTEDAALFAALEAEATAAVLRTAHAQPPAV
eukprot:CAMPEP_0185835292 /NCGR_PEP_ID=MMETSP1353-20130828/7447_1 /TAXON_ID=1077150 /ORGANISM="Erythrolobus australicus, Strain CCMP3124" /LENGTH=82 /DNA_ID=CAMNT_0028533891 /DNA_START=73 /DNA_END=317 /DNA_ORIENTATION=-